MARDDTDTRWRGLRLELVSAGAQLAECGLIKAGEGNLSARIDDHRCLMTPAGWDKGRLDPVDLIVVPFEPVRIPADASSEARMHVALYERFPAVASVVHAHPPRVQEIAAADRIPDCELLVEGRHLLGSVGRVDPIEPGSWRLAGAVVAALEAAPACMMDRHGAVSVGPDVGVAVRRMLLLERLATLTLTATS